MMVPRGERWALRAVAAARPARTMSESAFGGPHPSRASLDPRRPICPVPPSESEKVAVDTQWEREMFKFRTAVEGTTIQRSEETGPEIMTAGFDRATIPKEQLDALRTHIKNDEPLRVADVLLYALPDVRAAPVAEVTIFDKKNREKVLGTEWHALGGRYKWAVGGDVGEDLTKVANCALFANWEASLRCCAYFSILEATQDHKGVGNGMLQPGQTLADLPRPPCPPPEWPPRWFVNAPHNAHKKKDASDSDDSDDAS